MKRLGVALIVGLLAASPLPVGGQPNSAAPDQTPKASASNEDKPSSYVPGLGEFMGRIQVDHAKLWLAGDARNWELAGYQLSELKEVFSDVQDLVPRYHNIPVGDMIDAIITGTSLNSKARSQAVISTSSRRRSIASPPHAILAIRRQIAASLSSDGPRNRISAIRTFRPQRNDADGLNDRHA